MKVKIHRGTHQIGGCITEIESNKGTKIIIDIGENLPSKEQEQVLGEEKNPKMNNQTFYEIQENKVKNRIKDIK